MTLVGHRLHRKGGGFSVLELTLALAIVGVLLAVLLPPAASWQDSAKFKAHSNHRGPGSDGPPGPDRDLADRLDGPERALLVDTLTHDDGLGRELRPDRDSGLGGDPDTHLPERAAERTSAGLASCRIESAPEAPWLFDS